MKDDHTTELLPQRQSDMPVAATEPRHGISIELAYEAVTAGKLNSEQIGVMKELLAMDSERKFAVAFVAMQAEMPTVKAIHAVPDKSGGVKYYVARFDEIDEQARPLCQQFGFGYTFDTLPVEAGRQTAVFTLIHKGGHSRSTRYSVRIGDGPPGTTESQADGSAISYAKRGAMCAGLSIMIDRDCDPRDLGDMTTHVTTGQADELERRVKETNSNLPAFFKFAGAKSFSEIPASKYEALDQLLRKKEQKGNLRMIKEELFGKKRNEEDSERSTSANHVPKR